MQTSSTGGAAAPTLRKPHLVCPAGSLRALQVAVDAGADAVYMGLKDATNARNFAGLNFDERQAREGIAYAHARGRQVFLALNTFADAREPERWFRAVDIAADLGADALICADVSVLAYAHRTHPTLRLHLSVQASATTYEAIEFYRERYGIQRAVLPRVLTLSQVGHVCRHTQAEIEVFGFGSLCVMVEGRCALSSYATGQSPNTAGVCSPPSAVRWEDTPQGVNARLNEVLIDRYAPDEPRGYPTLCKGRFDVEGVRDYALKPMNCPGHVLIYKQGVKSYRDLPLRYGEFGQCHRNEPTGGLHGIMRVRGFTQDDGHIFCTEDHILPECEAFTTLLQRVYRDFGFTEIIYKVATRPAARIGSDELWDKAEHALMESLRRSGCEFTVAPGDGAFYGPKIEYTLKDAIGRQWQCGTMQVDFNLAERLDAEYVGEDGARHRPVVLHRAIVGSLERFIGILIEQHAGALPVWLAPVQATVLNITDAQAEYAAHVTKTLRNQGLRVECDLRNEKITYKIREHSLQKVPFILVVGDKEKEAGTVAVRARGNQDLGTMSVDAFSQRIASDIAQRI